MPTAPNPAATIDRPYGPGEFARFAETTGQGAIDQAQYMAPVAPEANYSSYPELQVEAERQAASDLAMSSHEFHVPQSQEVEEHQARLSAERIHDMAVEATLAGGVENMLSQGDSGNANYLDAPEATSPRMQVEARCGSDGAVLEAYRSGCAMVGVRSLYIQNPELN